jgi:hypothetical protein
MLEVVSKLTEILKPQAAAALSGKEETPATPEDATPAKEATTTPPPPTTTTATEKSTLLDEESEEVQQHTLIHTHPFISHTAHSHHATSLIFIFFIINTYIYSLSHFYTLSSHQVRATLIFSLSEHELEKQIIERAEGQLRIALKEFGYQITEKSKQHRDGSCWAGALAFGANLIGRHYTKSSVREITQRQLMNNSSQYLPFLTFTEEFSNEEAKLAAYVKECQKLSKAGVWNSDQSNIGDLLVPAFANAEDLSVMVVNSDGSHHLAAEQIESRVDNIVFVGRLCEPKSKEHYHGVVSLFILNFEF